MQASPGRNGSHGMLFDWSWKYAREPPVGAGTNSFPKKRLVLRKGGQWYLVRPLTKLWTRFSLCTSGLATGNGDVEIGISGEAVRG